MTKESWFFELLGGVSVRSDSRQLEDLVGKKPGALLALLALSPGRTRPREEVIDLIWPEVDFDNARNRFKQTLAALRKQLEPAGVAPGSVLIADRSQVGITAEHKSDVAEFQQSLRSAAVATEPVARAQHLRTALALYKGEFAPGFYLDVLLTERERLNALAQSARERLAELEGIQPTEVALPDVVAPAVSLHPTNAFFGRRAERDHLAFLLMEHRLVTLLGPGGTGKTRLTQELQAATPRSHFVSLSTLRSGASIPDAIVSALALPNSTEPALERLKSALTDTLLVLDNFEQLVATGGPEALSALLKAIPTLRLLVTSRLKLNLAAEQVFPLSPLPEGDALALFCDRARLAHPHFALTDENEEAVTELCKRLDGLPLAIELAAARAAILTPQQILERLSRRFDLLADKRRDREERHTSLRAALDWGWGLLAPDVQHFFTQLCIFRGSFSLEATEIITGEFLAIDYLQSLTDGSFLVMEVGGKRFRLLETLREYGLEKLSKDVREVLGRAHMDYFFARVTEWRTLLSSEAFMETMEIIKQEHENILAALDKGFIIAPEDAASSCHKLYFFWECAHWTWSALPYLYQALEIMNRRGTDEEILARLHRALGNLHSFQNEYDLALPFRQLEYSYRSRQWAEYQESEQKDEVTLQFRQRQLAASLHNLGLQFCYEHRYDEAEPYFQEARKINHIPITGNIEWLALNYHSLSNIYTQKGLREKEKEKRVIFFEQSLIYSEEGTIHCRHAKQDFRLCLLLHARAYILPLIDRTEDSFPLIEEGLSLACRVNNRFFIVCFLFCYYKYALFEKRYEEAAQFQGAAYSLHKQWEINIDKDDSHLRPQVNLPEILGTARYELLYEAGAQASLEALQTLAAGFHTPALRQKQAH
ncbi:BTAD domain-containing putative transcriptional regulator [Armatimonas sp.]|uniref:BTAD domain-containing putative transcriptional regulator n=1 Tax=Armatimonas sp. TaxID=1872638 RepID=UPI00286C5812|nr:BTAD domain-containing putative transcriptional regulator [Armatimonas sp.]